MQFNHVEEIIYKVILKNDLFLYYKPSEVLGFCESCPNYGKIWTCPPYGTDVINTFNGFDYAIVIGFKGKDFFEIKKESTEYLYELEGMKENVSGLSYTTLVAGNCEICETCSKSEGQLCRFPDRMRYSLESVGFHVSEICDEVLGESLMWQTENPKYMAVAGILLEKKDLEAMVERIHASNDSLIKEGII